MPASVRLAALAALRLGDLSDTAQRGLELFKDDGSALSHGDEHQCLEAESDRSGIEPRAETIAAARK